MTKCRRSWPTWSTNSERTHPQKRNPRPSGGGFSRPRAKPPGIEPPPGSLGRSASPPFHGPDGRLMLESWKPSSDCSPSSEAWPPSTGPSTCSSTGSRSWRGAAVTVRAVAPNRVSTTQDQTGTRPTRRLRADHGPAPVGEITGHARRPEPTGSSARSPLVRWTLIADVPVSPVPWRPDTSRRPGGATAWDRRGSSDPTRHRSELPPPEPVRRHPVQRWRPPTAGGPHPLWRRPRWWRPVPAKRRGSPRR